MDPLADPSSNSWRTPSPLDWFRDSWPSWFDIFSDWLLAWTGLPRYESFDVSENEIAASAEREVLGYTGFVKVAHGLLNHGTLPAATKLQVMTAMRHANAGTQLPLAWEMILRSRTSSIQDRTRECVVDACTAAETALAEAVGGTLLGGDVTQLAMERIIKQAGGVYELAILARDLTLIDKESVSEVRKLAESRNKALHRGASMERAAANKALKTATGICQRVLPI